MSLTLRDWQARMHARASVPGFPAGVQVCVPSQLLNKNRLGTFLKKAGSLFTA
jgi:hypothetical protein